MMDLSKAWRVYHLVQPYFFAHHHFHRRKVETLRQAGFDAWLLACVPEPLYRAHRSRYREAAASGLLKILRAPREDWTNRLVAAFLAKEILLGRRLAVHVLRCDPTPVVRLRQWRFIGPRVRFVLEYEGDMPSELVYQQAYVEVPRPPEIPPEALRSRYEHLLASQLGDAGRADGLVLMSREHVELWERRLGRPVEACCLPTLADPARIRFDVLERERTRAELGLEGRFVLTYAGNVFAKWQRLAAMCGFVSRLAERIPDLWFLALVRVDDLPLANRALARHGIADRAIALHVPSGDVSRYLSAADAALFLRHEHSMNTVVTSGKLSEYLAAGLPVITTGANAAVLNDLIRDLDAGVFLADSLPVDDRLVVDIQRLRQRTASPEVRARICAATTERFSGPRDPFAAYAPFMWRIIGGDGGKM